MIKNLVRRSRAALLGAAAAVLVAAPGISAIDASCHQADVLSPYWNADVELTTFSNNIFVMTADVRWGPIYIGTGGAANFKTNFDYLSFEMVGFEHGFALYAPSAASPWGKVVDGSIPCEDGFYYFVLP